MNIISIVLATAAILASLAGTAMITYSFSSARGFPIPFSTITFVGFAVQLGGYHLCMLAQRAGKTPRLWRITQIALIIVVACMLISISPVWYRWPLFLRFHISKDALEQEVQALQDIPESNTAAERWIGWYYVERIRSWDDGDEVFLITNHDRGLGFFGFMYSESGDHGDDIGLPSPWQLRRPDLPWLK